MKNNKIAFLYAGMAMLCWSTVAVAFKRALESLSVAQLLLIANYVALLALIIQVAIRGKISVCFHQTRRQLLSSMLLGLLNPFVYYLILFKAYYLLPAQVAQPINFIWPIMLMLLSVPLLGQKLHVVSLIALLVSFSGVLILSLQGRIDIFAIEEPVGVMLALSSSIIWALYWIFNLKDKRDDQIKLLVNFFFSSVYITAWCLLTGELRGIPCSGILPAVYSGLFEMGITFVLWMKALQYATTTAKVSNLIYITPFVSLIFIHLFLHEKIYLTSVTGLMLIITGIFIQQYGVKEKK
ncbi:MAG: DMT family transporter [Bacteroidales bacterium]|nr:DMT family transporter [Bacteroidales bacterium]